MTTSDSLIALLQEEIDATIHLAAATARGDGGLTYIDGLSRAIAIVRQHKAKREGVLGAMAVEAEYAADNQYEIPDNADDSFPEEKLRNVMLAHLDGVYRMSARANCDRLVTQISKRYLRTREPVLSNKKVCDAVRRIKDQYQEMLNDCGGESAGWYGWIGLSDVKELLAAIDHGSKDGE